MILKCIYNNKYIRESKIMCKHNILSIYLFKKNSNIFITKAVASKVMLLYHFLNFPLACTNSLFCLFVL